MSTPVRLPKRFEIKQGDTAPALETILYGGDDGPLDLTNADDVAIRMALCEYPFTVKLNLVSVTFAPDTSGAVSYQWQAGDTDDVGVYDLEWVATFPGAQSMTVPSSGFDTVVVTRHAGSGSV